MVVVKKPNGTLCICIEAKDLNKVLKCSHYPLPTIEDIQPDLSRAKVFHTFDVKNDFWHIELDEESSKLTTFNTPFGRYHWLQLPFGLSSAPEEFQRRQYQVIDRVLLIHDDILHRCASREIWKTLWNSVRNAIWNSTKRRRNSSTTKFLTLVTFSQTKDSNLTPAKSRRCWKWPSQRMWLECRD